MDEDVDRGKIQPEKKRKQSLGFFRGSTGASICAKFENTDRNYKAFLFMVKYFLKYERSAKFDT